MVLSSVERDESPKHTKQVENVQVLTCMMENQFCYGWWTWKIENESNNKWIGKSHFFFESWGEEYMQLVGEKIVGIDNHVELVKLSCRRETNMGLDLNEEPMKRNDVGDQPTPIVKLPWAHEYAQLLSKFVMKNPSNENAIFINSLNKMLIFNMMTYCVIWWRHYHGTKHFLNSKLCDDVSIIL